MGKWVKGLLLGLGMLTFSTTAGASGLGGFGGGGGSFDPDCFVSCLQAAQQDACRIGDAFICKRQCKVSPEITATYLGKPVEEQYVDDGQGNISRLSPAYVASRQCALDLGLSEDGTVIIGNDGQTGDVIIGNDGQGPLLLCGVTVVDTNDACQVAVGDTPEQGVVSVVNFRPILDEIYRTGVVNTNVFPIIDLEVPLPDGDTTPIASYPKCTASKHQPMPAFFGGGYGYGCGETRPLEWIIQGCPATACCSQSEGCFIQGEPGDGYYNQVL